MIYVSGIPSTRVDEVWLLCKEYVEMGNNKSHEEMNIDDIYERLINAEMQLWLIFNEDSNIQSVLTTEIVIYPRKKTCRIVTLGGEAEITETTSELQDTVFGVVSKLPALRMNNGAGNDDSHPFIAMTGRVPVRVQGTVEKGQRLVSSSVKGTARAVATGESINPFHVIGRALESKTDSGIGLVNCVVRTNN